MATQEDLRKKAQSTGWQHTQVARWADDEPDRFQRGKQLIEVYYRLDGGIYRALLYPDSIKHWNSQPTVGPKQKQQIYAWMTKET